MHSSSTKNMRVPEKSMKRASLADDLGVVVLPVPMELGASHLRLSLETKNDLQHDGQHPCRWDGSFYHAPTTASGRAQLAVPSWRAAFAAHHSNLSHAEPR
jgi:hypothetical protein